MRARRVVCVIVVALLALPVMAQPAEGGVGWWGWLVEGWQAVVRVFAGSEEPAEEPTTEAAPEDESAACLPLIGCPETDDDGGPSMDPDG